MLHEDGNIESKGKFEHEKCSSSLNRTRTPMKQTFYYSILPWLVSIILAIILLIIVLSWPGSHLANIVASREVAEAESELAVAESEKAVAEEDKALFAELEQERKELERAKLNLEIEKIKAEKTTTELRIEKTKDLIAKVKRLTELDEQ